MSGLKKMKISLEIIADLVKGNLRMGDTDDIPADARVVAVFQDGDDVCLGTMTALIESEEWPNAIEGSMPPTVIPEYTQKSVAA